jgi:hypothetical protein
VVFAGEKGDLARESGGLVTHGIAFAALGFELVGEWGVFACEKGDFAREG